MCLKLVIMSILDCDNCWTSTEGTLALLSPFPAGAPSHGFPNRLRIFANDLGKFWTIVSIRWWGFSPWIYPHLFINWLSYQIVSPFRHAQKPPPKTAVSFINWNLASLKKEGIYWEGTRPKPWPWPSELRDMFAHHRHHHHHHHHNNNNNNNKACGEEATPKLISASNQHPLHLHRVPKETTTGLPWLR